MAWRSAGQRPIVLGTAQDTSHSVSDLVGRVRCVSDQRGNALLVSANVHFFPQLLKLIQDLDAPSDKVTIEARIVQVSSDYLDQLGVRWSPNGSQVFSGEDYDNSILASGSGSYQKGFGGNINSSSTTSTSTRFRLNGQYGGANAGQPPFRHGQQHAQH